jgi:predicted nucleotidyltransferase
MATAPAHPDGADPVTGVARLLAAADDGRLDALCERLGVRLLGVFGSAARAHRGLTPEERPPRDLDVAVSFAGPPRLLDLIDALTEMTDCDTVDVAVIDGATPVLRAEALVGIPLFEATRGDYAVTQMAALAERRDTAHLRRLDLDALRG